MFIKVFIHYEKYASSYCRVFSSVSLSLQIFVLDLESFLMSEMMETEMDVTKNCVFHGFLNMCSVD